MDWFIFSDLSSFLYCLLISLSISIYFWYCELVISNCKKQYDAYSLLFIALLLFVCSEALLFISYIWSIFSYLWVFRFNNILFADAIELTFSNTILLSIAASCLCVYSLRTNVFNNNLYFYLAYFAAFFFLFLQIKEYQSLNFYMTDSYYTSAFYLVTALHKSHVIIGIVLLNATFSSLYNINVFYLNIQLLYWHFIEFIWIVIYFIFYSSFMRIWNILCTDSTSISISFFISFSFYIHVV